MRGRIGIRHFWQLGWCQVAQGPGACLNVCHDTAYQRWSMLDSTPWRKQLTGWELQYYGGNAPKEGETWQREVCEGGGIKAARHTGLCRSSAHSRFRLVFALGTPGCFSKNWLISHFPTRQNWNQTGLVWGGSGMTRFSPATGFVYLR